MESFLKTLNQKEQFYFLTIKAQPGAIDKLQNTGYIHDQCKKISNQFFIVRELNKTQNGFHFHVLLSLKKNIHKGWYKRHCHYNLQKIGAPKEPPPRDKPVPTRDMVFTLQEIEEARYLFPEEVQSMIEDNESVKLTNKAKKEAKKKIINDNIMRVASYMVKEWTPEHKLYVHYSYYPRLDSK